MSLLMKLMGKRLLGTVEIKFYSRNEASVEYESETTDETQIAGDLVQLFALYYSKTLCDLGRGKPAEALIAVINAAKEDVLTKIDSEPVSLLNSETTLTKPKPTGVTKVHTGELYGQSEQRFINTHSTRVEQGYYAPLSAIIFLEYLIRALPTGLLKFLFVSLAGMHKYYRESGDYSSLRNISRAPDFGFATARGIFERKAQEP
jgi:hypothetical protein